MNRQAGDEWPGDAGRPGDDQQPGDRQGSATHRIVGSPTSLAIANPGDDQDRQDLDESPGWRSALREFLDSLRFVNQSPGSLRDQIEYAIDGAYSNRADGPWRKANIVFALFIAIPGLSLCYLIGGIFFTRLSRTLTCGIVLLFGLMLLNAIPVTAWLIPDRADFTTWWGGQ